MITTERWVATITDPQVRKKILELRQRYDFLSKHLFSQFEPTRQASQRSEFDFTMRMGKWLDQFCSDRRKITAFRSIEYLFFAGRDEFYELYRCAQIEIKRWLIEVYELDPFCCNESLRKEIKHSWFCPITDSFSISSFLHSSGLTGGSEYRPDWLSMSKFAVDQQVFDYIQSKQIRNLVLLEDFVGSGSQARGVVDFVASKLDVKILIVPLIICAPGVKALREISEANVSVWLRPIISVPSNCLVSPDASSGEPALFEDLREVMGHHYESLGKNLKGDQFGFGKVGSLVVTYGNCPNNTPPIFHQARANETALFPRITRPWAAK